MRLPFLTMQDVTITNKRLLMREDFNVPVQNGKVQSDLRIHAAVPGIKQALAAHAQVILMSHLGRPEAGHWEQEFSLEPVAHCLEKLLQTPVTFIKDWQHGSLPAQAPLILLENVRFLVGETENSPTLSKAMAELCDVFVMDAFGSAHRAHASTVGVAEYAAAAVAGPLLVAEVTALNQIMEKPRHPVVSIIGGAKISTKLAVLESMLQIVDVLLIGGGMANTLLAAQGINVGASLCERELIPAARELLTMAQEQNCQILLPTDVLVQDGIAKPLDKLQATDQILDIGSATVQAFAQQINAAATVLWNGPLGKFEDPKFANGTHAVAEAITKSTAFSVIGGGETLTAIEQWKLQDKFSYISTGGGAFLEYIEGKTLPAISALINKRKQSVKKN